MLWVRILLRWSVLDTTLCAKVCQWIAAGQWFSLVTPVSSTNKTDHHDLTEILFKVALNNIKPNQSIRIEEVSFSIQVFELHILNKWSALEASQGQKKNMCVYGHPTYPNFC